MEELPGKCLNYHPEVLQSQLGAVLPINVYRRLIGRW